MIKRPASFDWNHIRAFLATVDEGSFSAAARSLGLTQPTLGRQVAALEEELGIALFDRAGRGMILTQPGRELLDHVRMMSDAADRIALTASGQSQTIEGEIRITASQVMATHILPPFLRILSDAAPQLHVDLVADDSLRDLQKREADIAIRHVRPDQPELIARLVREANARLYAASDYLDRRGRPASVEDLQAHDFVSFGDDQWMLEFLNSLGLNLGTHNIRHGSASGVAAWALVEQGLGIAIMSDHVARRSAGIEAVLPATGQVRFPIWLTTHRELHTSRRIRLVFDMLGEFLKKDVF